jgi:hypothetical protein
MIRDPYSFLLTPEKDEQAGKSEPGVQDHEAELELSAEHEVWEPLPPLRRRRSRQPRPPSPDKLLRFLWELVKLALVLLGLAVLGLLALLKYLGIVD